MAKHYYLRFLLKDESHDLIFPVSKKDSDRIANLLGEMYQPEGRLDFFWFDTTDGKSVIINLNEVQAVRCLWEPSGGPADLVRHEGPVQIKLRGRRELLEDHSYDEAEAIHDLYQFLEMGPDTGTFHSFLDEDGELLFLNEREIVWVMAPLQLLVEGRKIIMKDSAPD